MNAIPNISTPLVPSQDNPGIAPLTGSSDSKVAVVRSTHTGYKTSAEIPRLAEIDPSVAVGNQTTISHPFGVSVEQVADPSARVEGAIRTLQKDLASISVATDLFHLLLERSEEDQAAMACLRSINVIDTDTTIGSLQIVNPGAQFGNCCLVLNNGEPPFSFKVANDDPSLPAQTVTPPFVPSNIKSNIPHTPLSPSRVPDAAETKQVKHKIYETFKNYFGTHVADRCLGELMQQSDENPVTIRSLQQPFVILMDLYESANDAFTGHLKSQAQHLKNPLSTVAISGLDALNAEDQKNLAVYSQAEQVLFHPEQIFLRALWYSAETVARSAMVAAIPVAAGAAAYTSIHGAIHTASMVPPQYHYRVGRYGRQLWTYYSSLDPITNVREAELFSVIDGDLALLFNVLILKLQTAWMQPRRMPDDTPFLSGNFLFASSILPIALIATYVSANLIPLSHDPTLLSQMSSDPGLAAVVHADDIARMAPVHAGLFTGFFCGITPSLMRLTRAAYSILSPNVAARKAWEAFGVLNNGTALGSQAVTLLQEAQQKDQALQQNIKAFFNTVSPEIQHAFSIHIANELSKHSSESTAQGGTAESSQPTIPRTFAEISNILSQEIKERMKARAILIKSFQEKMAHDAKEREKWKQAGKIAFSPEARARRGLF